MSSFSFMLTEHVSYTYICPTPEGSAEWFPQEAWVVLFILVMFISEFMVIKLLIVTLVLRQNNSVSTCNFHVRLTANFCSVLI